MRMLWCCALACCALLMATQCAAATATNSAQPNYSFGGPEIFPIENFISNLRLADVDGDGKLDLVVANNARSRINILYNQTGRTNPPPSPSTFREQNTLPPDARFRIESLPSEKRITSLVVRDLNSDNRPDLAYYGEPRELVVQFQTTNGWKVPRVWQLDDGQLTPDALACEDLNGDHRPDLALLGERQLHILLAQPDGTFSEPMRLQVSGAPQSLHIVDVNSDQLPDLVFVEWEARHPFRLRLQQPDKQFAPEIFFASPSLRAYCLDQFSSGSPVLIASILQQSGRARLSEIKSQDSEPLESAFRQGQFLAAPLTRTERVKRGLAWADVNSDSLADLIVAVPESGQLIIQLQSPSGDLGPIQVFPSLAGISQLRVADWDQDNRPEIFMLSVDERQVGLATLDAAGRLPFPELVQTTGRPLAIAVGKPLSNAPPALAIITEADDERRLEIRSASGTNTVKKLNSAYKGTPSAVTWHDADQDGLPDLVVLTPYEKAKILRQTEAGNFEEIDVSLPGGASLNPWMSSLDLDNDGKPELVLAQNNFIRATVLTRGRTPSASSNSVPAWVLQVKEQINGPQKTSRLAGAALLIGSDSLPRLLLLDTEHKELTVCKRDSANVWRAAGAISLPVSDLSALEAIHLGTNRLPCVALSGQNTAALQLLHGPVYQLLETGAYETPIKDGRLNDLIAGDLNGDGVKELVFLETERNYVDIARLTAERKLTPASRWQVFEERTFRGRNSAMPEPREAAVADVTGDGKNDLILLVHDRLLVYPQE